MLFFRVKLREREGEGGKEREERAAERDEAGVLGDDEREELVEKEERGEDMAA